MRLVHLSDLHLGLRAFPRTERGWNLRERDLATAFRAALQEVVRLRPDLILLTGDLFDRPDPPGTALLTLQRGIGLLRTQLPGAPILAIAGERDTPANPADPGPLALLDAVPGVEAAAGSARSVRFRALGLHALLVPHRAALAAPFPRIAPDPEARFNLLLIRGRVGEGEEAFPIDPEGWSYIAVGGPHRARSWAPNIRTAGALERPGRSPWEEAIEERGFLSFDLATGESEFHPIAGRPVVDLAPIRVAAGDPDSGTRRLRELLEGIPGGTEGKAVRVRLRGDVLAPGEGISEGLLTAIRERAAHVELHLEGARSVPPSVRGGSGLASAPSILVGGEGAPPLPAGLLLLTAATESLRLRLARELAGRVDGGGLAESEVRLHPPPAREGRGRALWAGMEDPVHLLRALLEGRAEDRAELSARESADPHAATTLGAPTPEPPGEIEEMEAALIALRADAIEASGDLEARTLEWVRDRQEADSKLLDYRERARELRSRIRHLEAHGGEGKCPTCGRALGEDAGRLVGELRDEWEAVVQDGRWWKRRRAQVEEKPRELQTMEEGALRLHAKVEEEAERAERLRERLRQGAGLLMGPTEPTTGGETQLQSPPDLERLPGVRELLRRSGNLLGAMTEGRVSGMRLRGGRVVLVAPGGEERRAEGTEAAALRFALRFAAWAAEGGESPILLSEFAGGEGEGLAPIALELVADLLPAGRIALALAPPSLLERIPERLADAMEFALDGRGRWTVRRLPVGIPLLTLLRSE